MEIPESRAGTEPAMGTCYHRDVFELLVPPRGDGPEWIDDPATSEADLLGAMETVARSNRLLGYDRLVTALAAKELGSEPTRVLDVGTGLGDIPLAFAARGRRRGGGVEALGIDLNERTIARARDLTAGDPMVRVEPVDLFDLPRDWGSFDVVTCHRTLHHLPTSAVPAFFAALDAALASGGVLLVGDLVRGRLREAATWAFLKAIGGHPAAVHDGILSIQNSFTPGELLALARQGGVTYLRRSLWSPPCHVLLVGRRSASLAESRSHLAR